MTDIESIKPIENTVNIKKMADNIIKTKKLSGNKWSLIEKPLSVSDKLRNTIISELGETNANTNITTIKSSTNLITIGEYNYLNLRKELEKFIILPPIKKTEEKKQKVNKKTTIILENCQNTLKNKIKILTKL
jgi:hypothetical protein